MMTRNKGAKFAPTSIQIPEAALGAFAVLLGVSVAIAAWGYRGGQHVRQSGSELVSACHRVRFNRYRIGDPPGRLCLGHFR